VSLLHRIEALAGNGRYAVTFQRDDHSEQTAVVQVTGTEVTAAEAGLPTGWTLDSEPFHALAEAVLAVQRARGTGPKITALSDVDGGWDVMMGNVVVDADGVPTCTAHGAMTLGDHDIYECSECGARAAYAA
jgi:hypothetical protein